MVTNNILKKKVYEKRKLFNVDFSIISYTLKILTLIIMKRHFILLWIIKSPIDFLLIIGSFFLAKEIRLITDLIPTIQLPIKTIPSEDLWIFALSGAILFFFILAGRWLYAIEIKKTLLEEIIEIFKSAFLWFLLYIGFVYLATGFIFPKEIPRLIIFFAWGISLIAIINFRLIYHMIYEAILRSGKFELQKIVIISNKDATEYSESIEKHSAYKIEYIFHPEWGDNQKNHISYKELLLLIRTRRIDEIVYINGDLTHTQKDEITRLSKIYGVIFAYTTNFFWTEPSFHHATNIGNLPIIEIRPITITPWERVLKRTIDLILSCIGWILLSPLLLLIAICIKIEDPSGPIIFRNRRVGIGGKEFFLYKFRYMYWKYSIKDAYWVDNKDDTALQYEETLKRKLDSRNGPLYKIENDPRRTKVGKLIEKLSLDELPQLWNVFLWNMSLIGPRPHQPREVEQYEEDNYQVLTIKPWITWMAQVHGREKNSFQEEIQLDTYYIEHYSLWMDLEILLRTIWIILLRWIR